MSSPKPVAVSKPTASGVRSPTSSSLSSTGARSPSSPSTVLKTSLKKLTVSGESGSTSPASRSRVTGGVAKPISPAAAPSLNSPTSLASKPRVSTMSTSTPSRTVLTKAPVQSPTAAGMKMRPASGAGLTNFSSIGPSAMAAVSSNPYSSTLGVSPQSPIASASPNSPIASASPNARRFKAAGTPTSSGVNQPASPIHSISQSNASASSGLRKSYESINTAAAAAHSSSVSASSYRAAHPNVHAPVNTHANPPATHVADHPNAPGGGPTIFSPVYSRTASQEQLLRLEEEKKAAAAGKKPITGTATRLTPKEEEEQRYRQQQALYQQQQQQAQAAAAAAAAAQAQALAAQQAAQQQQHTVSYTPPPVEEDEFDPFLFIKNLPPLSPAMRNRKSPLPKKSLKAPPITLALDLDETLVHCSVQPIERAELTFKVAFNGMDYEVYVRTRPHMKEFLETVSQWFEIIIFTASQKVYADKLLNILDPHGQYIKYRVFRDSCVCVDGNYLKDLHILGREIPHVAIVDNSVQAFGFQLDNGIPIESWFDDDNDRELLNLIPFLRTLKDCKDVRPLIRDTFRLSEFVASL